MSCQDEVSRTLYSDDYQGENMTDLQIIERINISLEDKIDMILSNNADRCSPDGVLLSVNRFAAVGESLVLLFKYQTQVETKNAERLR